MDRQIVRKNVKESRQRPIFWNYRPQLLFRVWRHRMPSSGMHLNVIRNILVRSGNGEIGAPRPIGRLGAAGQLMRVNASSALPG